MVYLSPQKWNLNAVSYNQSFIKNKLDSMIQKSPCAVPTSSRQILASKDLQGVTLLDVQGEKGWAAPVMHFPNNLNE